MVVYYTDYSKRTDDITAWVKKTNGKTRNVKTEKIVPTNFVNGSFAGELMAIYFAVCDAVRCRYTNVVIRNDNKVAIDLLNKGTSKRRPRKANVKFILYLVENMAKNIKSIQFEWIPREQNREADALSKSNGEKHENFCGCKKSSVSNCTSLSRSKRKTRGRASKNA